MRDPLIKQSPDGTFGEPKLPGTSKQHRIFYTTTKDFEHFDETKLLFDPGCSCIDAFILKDGSSGYLLFFKDERGNEADEKLNPNWQNIRMALSNNMYGPYGNITGPITSNGEGEWHNEGPCAVKFKDEYFLFYDHHSGDTYFGAVKSDDLKEWSDISHKMNFPDGTKHGSIIKVNKIYLEKLLEVEY